MQQIMSAVRGEVFAMKNTKKLLALLLALLLTLGGLTAWAEDEPQLPEPEQSESAEAASAALPEPQEQTENAEAALRGGTIVNGSNVDENVTVKATDAPNGGGKDITVTVKGDIEGEQHTDENVKGVYVKPTQSAPPVVIQVDNASVNPEIDDEDAVHSVTVNVGEDGKGSVTEKTTGTDDIAYSARGILVSTYAPESTTDVEVNAGDITVEAVGAKPWADGVFINNQSAGRFTVNTGEIEASARENTHLVLTVAMMAAVSPKSAPVRSRPWARATIQEPLE